MARTHTDREQRLLSLRGRHAARYQNVPRSGGDRAETPAQQEKNEQHDKRYKRIDALTDYVHKTHATLDKKLASLTTALGKKGKNVDRLRGYRNEVKKFMSTYLETRDNDSTAIEQKFAEMEHVITRLEEEVLKAGGTVERRYADFAQQFAVERVKSAGLVALPDPRRKGVNFLDLPRDWRVTEGLTPAPISPHADPSETSHDVSGTRRRIYFDGRSVDKMTVAFQYKGMDVSYGLPASKRADGSVEFAVNGLVSLLAQLERGEQMHKMNEAHTATEAKQQELDSQKRTPEEVAARVSTKQQSSETAKEVVMSLFGELKAIDTAKESGALTPEEYEERKNEIVKNIAQMTKKVEKLLTEESIRLIREGDPSVQTKLDEFAQLFPEIFGQGPEANAEFERWIRPQLDRMDLPYILKHDGEGKLRFVENARQVDSNTQELVNERDNRFNMRLAYQTIEKAIWEGGLDPAAVDGVMKQLQEDAKEAGGQEKGAMDLERATGMVIANVLSASDATDKFGVYLDKDGNLKAAKFGFDALMVSGFKNKILFDPIQALRDLSSITDAMPKQAKAVVDRAKDGQQEFEDNRRLTRAEASSLLDAMVIETKALRDAVTRQTAAPYMLVSLNQHVQRLAKGVDYPERIENLLASKQLLGPIEGTQWALVYNAASQEMGIEEVA